MSSRNANEKRYKQWTETENGGRMMRIINFGLLWEDFEKLLQQLGYKLHLDLAKVA